jgi:predicted nuclease with RNAse H fold
MRLLTRAYTIGAFSIINRRDTIIENTHAHWSTGILKNANVVGAIDAPILIPSGTCSRICNLRLLS